MAIFLLVLKILLISLLALLALLLFLLIVLLFIPIYYDIQADKEEEITVNIKAVWLFGLVRFRFAIEKGQQQMMLKLLWFRLMGDNEESKKPRKSRRKSKKATPDASAPPFRDDEPEKPDENIPAQEADTSANAKKSSPSSDHAGESHASSDHQKDIPESSGEIALGKDLRTARDTVTDILQKIQMFLDYREKKVILRHTLRLLQKWWKVFRPKTFQAYGEIGLSDVALTGMILGAVSAIKALLFIPIQIVGNFEEEVIRFRVRMKGWMTLWGLLFPLIKYVCKKPIWRMIKTLRSAS